MTTAPALVPTAVPDGGLGGTHSPATSSPLSSPDNNNNNSKVRRKAAEPRRQPMSPTQSPTTGHPPHPLSQPPITATANTSRSPSSSAAPLETSDAEPSPPALSAQVKQSLRRRRSSFPPASGSTVTAQPWIPGEQPVPEVAPMGSESFSAYNLDAGWPSANGLTPMTGNWESLLNFGSDYVKSPAPPVEPPSKPEEPSKPEPDVKSTPRYNTPPKNGRTPQGMERTESGTDQTWRSVLNQTLDVEGVGNVAVARILTEVWKRGGPAAVTAYSLWSSVLVSLSLSPDHGTSVRASPPSAQAALSLQALYNVAIRPHEATIFAGFLTSYHSSTVPAAVNAFQDPQVYGPWTPTKGLGDPDLAQWTTFTPGAEWPSLSTTLPSGSGLTPGREFSPALGLPPIAISAANDEANGRPESRGPEGINGLDEILADMEDTSEQQQPGPLGQIEWGNGSSRTSPSGGNDEGDVFQSSRRLSSSHDESPVETMVPLASSPFVSGASTLSATSASTNIPSVGPAPAPPPQEKVVRAAATPSGMRVRPPPPLQLSLPDAPFIPPPPMCMFFSPTFRDLQQGKVAVWKGDLVIRGRGGGTFNVLIIGEQGSDHLWQSHTWHSRLTYPPAPVVTETYTATMIPVSTLAREGLLPVTMGMVLCNDDKMDAFVHMVQGLHAEGVAFHLPMPGSGLPIVFLPAKFDSADPLQRLGIAFMTKGGAAPDFVSASSTRRPSDDSEVSSPAENKRQRKSSSKDAKEIAPRPATKRKKVTVRPKAS